MIYDIQKGVKQLTPKQATALNSISALNDVLFHWDTDTFNRIASDGDFHETLFVTDGKQTLKVEIKIQSWKESE